MRRIAAALLVIALVASAWRLKSVNDLLAHQQQLVSEQGRQIRDLQQQLEDRSEREALSLQIECSEMARTFVAARSLTPDVGDHYRNYFNPRLKKCLVLVTSYSRQDDFVAIDLYDAIQGGGYATFSGRLVCDAVIDPNRCALNSGQVWFDGDDSRVPADVIAGFGGLAHGQSGGKDTLNEFLAHVRSFMSQ